MPGSSPKVKIQLKSSLLLNLISSTQQGRVIPVYIVMASLVGSIIHFACFRNFNV